MPAHLRLATVKLWLRSCLATENKKVFKEAAQKGHELGMDAGEIYLMDAELKQRLSRSRSAPQEKTALQKESQYLKEEARKVWPKGLNAKTGQWVLANSTCHRGRRQSVGRKINGRKRSDSCKTRSCGR